MSELTLPKLDKFTISHRLEIINKLKKIINPENVLAENEEMKPYETDALSAYKQMPLAVILPENTQEVSAVLKYCNKENIKVIPRGAGTGLSGGALPLQDAGVAIIPGTAFGKFAVNNVRLNFATSEEDLSKALEKINNMLG